MRALLTRIFREPAIFSKPMPVTFGQGKAGADALHQALLNQADRELAKLSRQKTETKTLLGVNNQNL